MQAGLPAVVTLADPPGTRDTRGRSPGRGVRAARRRRRRRRRTELHPRAAHDAAADRARSARRSTATSRRCRSPTGRLADEPSFQSLTDPGCDCLPDDRPFPTALDPLLCNRYEIAEFAARRTSSASATWASAAAPRRT